MKNIFIILVLYGMSGCCYPDSMLDYTPKANIVFDWYYISGRGYIHGDYLNKGETVYLQVSLKNTGSITANSVKATFSTTSPYVLGFTPTTQIDYGNIKAKNSESKDINEFTVSTSTPAYTKIPINISIVDAK